MERDHYFSIMGIISCTFLNKYFFLSESSATPPLVVAPQEEDFFGYVVVFAVEDFYKGKFLDSNLIPCGGNML